MANFEYEAQRIADDLNEAKTSLLHLYEKVEIITKAFAALDENLPEFEPTEGAYGYIPVDISDFLQTLIDLKEVLKDDPDYIHSDLPFRPCAFLEVGCGTGRNVFLAKHAEQFHFAKIVGFDISDPYIEHGRRLFGLDNELFVDDCMTFDYGGFDIIHFYKPFSDDEQEMAFEQRVVETMKRAACVIGDSASSLDDSRLLIPLGDSGRIWKRL